MAGELLGGHSTDRRRGHWFRRDKTQELPVNLRARKAERWFEWQRISCWRGILQAVRFAEQGQYNFQAQVTQDCCSRSGSRAAPARLFPAPTQGRKVFLVRSLWRPVSPAHTHSFTQRTLWGLLSPTGKCHRESGTRTLPRNTRDHNNAPGTRPPGQSTAQARQAGGERPARHGRGQRAAPGQPLPQDVHGGVHPL